MTRHKRTVVVRFPEWVSTLVDPCMQSTAEDVYIAKALAEESGAAKQKRCQELMRAAGKSLAVFENSRTATKKRCHEGDRAARKYWEAKVCARERPARRRK